METQNFIRFKDRGVALGIAALAILCFVFVYRSAADRHELERLRDQNVILTKQLKKLNASYQRIRDYTKTAGSLATSDVTATQLSQADELSFVDSNGPGSVLGKMTLAAKSAAGNLMNSDLDTFTTNLAMVDDLNRDTDVVVRRLSSLATILRYNNEVTHTIPSVMPIEGRITSEFGVRLSPFDGKRTMHAGLDIAAEVGTDVHAPADGTVTFAGNFETLGQAVVISHGTSHVLTRYGHLSRLRVHVGDKVKRGQVIANSGNSGHSTGPHLHYEVWVKNVAVNPRDFFFDLTDQTALMVQAPKAGKQALHVASANLSDDM